ncbi:MAG: hypothetical protein ACFB0B_00730 [Thermonemataceae bacterium]
MRVFSLSLSWILLCLLLVACDDFARFSAVRITSVNVDNDSLSFDIAGEFIDNEDDRTIVDHGFCFSRESFTPRLDQVDTDSVSLGMVVDEDDVFSATVERLIPNSNYFVRAFMIIDEEVIYSTVRRVDTPNFNVLDFLISTEYAIVTGNTIEVKGAVNEIPVEGSPITIIRYGSLVAAEPDSTSTLSMSVDETVLEEGSATFLHQYDIAMIPTSGLPLPVNRYYIWSFVEFTRDDNPIETRTIYTGRRSVLTL